MLLLHLLLSFSFYSNPGPRTTRPSCHFLGLFMKTLPHFRSRNRRPLVCVSLLLLRIRISPNENKRHDHFQKNVINVYWAQTPADEVRQLQDVSPCQPWQGGRFSPLTRTYTGFEIYSTCRAFPSFFTSCIMMKGPLFNSALAVKHKVSGSERETPTFISFTEIPLAWKET